MIEPLSSLWRALIDRFWTWLQFPWVYEHTYRRTCTHCGSSQELVLAFNDKPHSWVSIEPFNRQCRYH